MAKAVVVVLSVVSFVLLVIMIVLAALYGSEYNCSDTAPVGMTHFPKIAANVKGAVSIDGTQASLATSSYINTIAYSQVSGKEMQGGVLRLKNKKEYTYDQWFEGFFLILEGQFTLNDNSVNGVALTGVPGESFYVPKGTRVKLTATGDSRLYYVMHPPGPEYAKQINDAINARPKIIKHKARKDIEIDLFVNDYDSLSYLKDFLFSKDTGRELTGGLYELKDGPALIYTYPYEEFKYIVSGEFHLKDGTGKEVVAKAGDLMYFPIGCKVEFTSPNIALGFFVGQRKGGEAK